MKRIFITFIVSFYILMVGYSSADFTAEVSVVVEELPVASLHVKYNGDVRQGEELNKDDFTVVPIYKWETDNSTSFLEGPKLNSNEFTITPTVISNSVNTVRVSYKGVYVDIDITASTKGRLTIKTDGLKATLTVEAIKQVEDDNILNNGKDIVYTIQSAPINEPVSENLAEVIELQKEKEKGLEVLKAYNINIKKDVTGENTTFVDKINNDIYITLGIPEDFIKENKEYWMAHEHKNSIELLKDTDDVLETITVQTSSFSSYVLYCTDIENDNVVIPDEKPTTEPSKKENLEDDSSESEKDDNSGGCKPVTEDDSVYQIPLHTHDHIEVFTKATCEKAGYREITCKICGSHAKSKIENPYGHDWSIKDKYGTTEVCVRCGKERLISRLSEKLIENDKPICEGEGNDIVDPTSLPDFPKSSPVPTLDPKEPVTLQEGESVVAEQTDLQIAELDDEEKGNLLCALFPLFIIIAALIIAAYKIYKKSKEKE